MVERGERRRKKGRVNEREEKRRVDKSERRRRGRE